MASMHLRAVDGRYAVSLHHDASISAGRVGRQGCFHRSFRPNFRLIICMPLTFLNPFLA